MYDIQAEIGTPSPDTGRAEGECISATSSLTISACIDQKAVPYAFHRKTTHMFN